MYRFELQRERAEGKKEALEGFICLIATVNLMEYLDFAGEFRFQIQMEWRGLSKLYTRCGFAANFAVWSSVSSKYCFGIKLWVCLYYTPSIPIS